MRVLIESDVWHLDVDSNYPPGVGARKGTAVRRLKINASWVIISPLLFKYYNYNFPVRMRAGYSYNNYHNKKIG